MSIRKRIGFDFGESIGPISHTPVSGKVKWVPSNPLQWGHWELEPGSGLVGVGIDPYDGGGPGFYGDDPPDFDGSLGGVGGGMLYGGGGGHRIDPVFVVGYSEPREPNWTKDRNGDFTCDDAARAYLRKVYDRIITAGMTQSSTLGKVLANCHGIDGTSPLLDCLKRAWSKYLTFDCTDDCPSTGIPVRIMKFEKGAMLLGVCREFLDPSNADDGKILSLGLLAQLIIFCGGTILDALAIVSCGGYIAGEVVNKLLDDLLRGTRNDHLDDGTPIVMGRWVWWDRKSGRLGVLPFSEQVFFPYPGVPLRDRNAWKF